MDQLISKWANEVQNGEMKLKWANEVENGPKKLKMTKSSSKLFHEVYQYRYGLWENLINIFLTNVLIGWTASRSVPYFCLNVF